MGLYIHSCFWNDCKLNPGFFVDGGTDAHYEIFPLFVCGAGTQSYLSPANSFEKGIYILDIGGNDFSYGYKNLKLSPSQVKQSILPIMARNVAATVKV